MNEIEERAERRSKSTAAVNVAAAKYESAKARVQSARSELGTANAELAKAAKEYAVASLALVTSLPELRASLERLKGIDREAVELDALSRLLGAPGLPGEPPPGGAS